ncbi:amino acid ABC transporter permease [Crossiella sp. NPDC003009]
MSGKTGLSRRQRARLFRGIQYGLLVVVLVVMAFLANWEKIVTSFFDFEVAGQLFPNIIVIALKNTIVYTALGFAFGIVVGVILALMRLSSVGPYRWIATLYIEFFRGLPALLVFLAVGFGIPTAFGMNVDRMLIITLALGIVASAYMAETIRAGIKAVPKGQVEAARSLGMSPTRTLVTVVIPQAFRIILPPLTNELIMLVKDSSLVFFIGSTLEQQELAQFGRQALSQYKSMTPFVVAGLCYLIITIPLSIVQQRLERKANATVKGGQ